MKKTLLLLSVALLLLAACKKNKSTGHVWLHVDMSHPLSTLGVPDSLRNTIAGGTIVTDSGHFEVAQSGDNGGTRAVKNIDFGEVAPGKYLIDSIHGYAYGDSAFVILGANHSTSTFTVTADHDQTLSVTF